MNQDMVSFVLRFVREVGEDQQARWRGVIKHVQGDSQEHFTQFAEALTFMQAHVNEVIRESFVGSAREQNANPLLETTRLWGELMPQYTKLMMATMEEAVNSNVAVTQQLQKNVASTLAAWGVPTREEQERTLTALESLTTQLAALDAKMDELEQRVRQE